MTITLRVVSVLFVLSVRPLRPQHHTAAVPIVDSSWSSPLPLPPSHRVPFHFPLTLFCSPAGLTPYILPPFSILQPTVVTDDFIDDRHATFRRRASSSSARQRTAILLRLEFTHTMMITVRVGLDRTSLPPPPHHAGEERLGSVRPFRRRHQRVLLVVFAACTQGRR